MWRELNSRMVFNKCPEYILWLTCNFHLHENALNSKCTASIAFKLSNPSSRTKFTSFMDVSQVINSFCTNYFQFSENIIPKVTIECPYDRCLAKPIFKRFIWEWNFVFCKGIQKTLKWLIWYENFIISSS